VSAESAQKPDLIDQALSIQPVDRRGMDVTAWEAADPFLVHDVRADADSTGDLGVEVRALAKSSP